MPGEVHLEEDSFMEDVFGMEQEWNYATLLLLDWW